MQPRFLGGVVLVVLGLIALSIRSITFFSHERVVGPLGFFAWDVSEPHTILINPVAGLIAIAVGSFLLFNARRSTRA